MCGIFGFHLTESGPDLGGDVLRRMGDAVRHRGPEEAGFFADGRFGFGIRRLSIIDLTTGRQPIHNEDESLQVVSNGEIYNYRELAEELRNRGHRLYTTSDTEVIVHLFEEYGQDCVQRLRGMFAFCVWDAADQSLVLARDRLGIKPLYYASTPSGLIFASEVKSILAFPGFERQIDVNALLAYLQYGYVPEPLSIFKHIRKLPPGHSLTARNGHQITVRRYWDPVQFFEAPSRPMAEAAVAEELRAHLTEAVRLHLVSDVPLGAFLSGGIDSSAVVALMAAELGRRVKTFTIGFKEDAFNEIPYARLVSERFGTDHHELVVGGEHVDLIERIVEYFDEPFADASAIPTYVVSRLAGEHVTVVLSGDGGDELFAGYERYVVDNRRRHYDVLSRLGISGLLQGMSNVLPEGSPGKNYLFNVSLPRMERYIDSVSHHRPRGFGQLLSADLQAEIRAGQADVVATHVVSGGALDFPSRLQYLDMKTYLPGDILTKVDRMSMAHSVEARVPFLDHRLVEFVAGIPSQYKLRHGETKYLFKRVAAELVPAEVLQRRKQGFGVPLTSWFQDGFQSYLREHLLGNSALRHGLLNRSYVEELMSAYMRRGNPDCLHRLWSLLVFELWHRRYMGT